MSSEKPDSTHMPTSVFVRAAWLAAMLAIYSALPTWFENSSWKDVVNIHANFHALLGLVVGVLLVFRTNTAYDRWWEGRKLWGQLVNESRNLAIKIQTCVVADEADKSRLLACLSDFAVALKEHLRHGVRLGDLKGFQGSAANPEHVPAYLSRSIYGGLEAWRRAGKIGEIELLFLDRHAAALMDICGACERIRKTPISLSYRRFIRQVIGLYLLTLPWGLAEDLGLWAIVTVAMIGYFMIGIELLAEDIEEPFGEHIDDLHLDDLCAAIDRSIREIAQTA